MKIFNSESELREAVGQILGPSRWVTIGQDRIDKFADATGDHQWIHVDAEKSAAGPFGTTIAHGNLTLSLIPGLAAEIYHVSYSSTRINYGLNKARYPQPVAVGSNVRLTSTIKSVTAQGPGLLLAVTHVIELEESERPACVAEGLTLLLI